MEDMKVQLIMTPPIGEKTILDIESCIIGGVLADGSGCPFGSFMGKLGFENSLLALSHVSRAFIKTSEEQLELFSRTLAEKEKTTKNERLEAIRIMMVSCIDRAIKVEMENNANENVDLDTHILKMRFDMGRVNGKSN